MPVMDGIEATRRLAGRDVGDPLTIIITTYDLDEHVHDAPRPEREASCSKTPERNSSCRQFTRLPTVTH